MNIDKSAFFLSSPREEIRHDDECVQTIQGGPESELNEVFERSLGHDAADPRTEMVHFNHAPAELTAVMGTVRLVIVTCGAEWWTAIPTADEYVFLPEVFRLDVMITFGISLSRPTKVPRGVARMVVRRIRQARFLVIFMAFGLIARF